MYGYFKTPTCYEVRRTVINGMAHSDGYETIRMPILTYLLSAEIIMIIFLSLIWPATFLAIALYLIIKLAKSNSKLFVGICLSSFVFTSLIFSGFI